MPPPATREEFEQASQRVLGSAPPGLSRDDFYKLIDQDIAEQHRPGSPTSPLGRANATPLKEPTTYEEGRNQSLGNTLRGFFGGVASSIRDLPSDVLAMDKARQEYGTPAQQQAEQAQAKTNPYGAGAAKEMVTSLSDPHAGGKMVGNLALGTFGPRALPYVRPAAGAVVGGAARVAETGGRIPPTAGAIIGSAVGGGEGAAVGAAVPPILRATGQGLRGAERIIRGPEPIKWMDAPEYPPSTPSAPPAEPKWMDPPEYPPETPPPPPGPPQATGTGSSGPKPTGPVTPSGGWSMRTGIPYERPASASPTPKAARPFEDLLAEEMQAEMQKPVVEPTGTTPPEPTITSSGREGDFYSSGRPAVSRTFYHGEGEGVPPSEPSPPPAAPSTLEQQLRDSLVAETGVPDPNAIRTIRQLHGSKTAGQILDIPQQGVKTASGASTSAFPEVPRARIDTWLAEHPNASPAELKAYIHAKGSNALSKSYIKETLKRSGMPDEEIAALGLPE